MNSFLCMIRQIIKPLSSNKLDFRHNHLGVSKHKCIQKAYSIISYIHNTPYHSHFTSPIKNANINYRENKA